MGTLQRQAEAKKRVDGAVSELIRGLGFLVNNETRQKQFMATFYSPYIFSRTLRSLRVDVNLHIASKCLMPLTRFYQEDLTIWATEYLKDINAQIDDGRCFLDDSVKRESILASISLVTHLFYGYTHIMRQALDPGDCYCRLQYADVQILLAPMSFPFKMLHILEAVVPTEKEIAGQIPTFSFEENKLLTNILNDLNSCVFNTCMVQSTPLKEAATLKEYRKKLAEDPNSKHYNEINNLLKAMGIVSRGLYLSGTGGGVFEVHRTSEGMTSRNMPSKADTSVWYNFPPSLHALFIMAYPTLEEDFERFFFSKEITSAFFKIMKYMHEDATTLAFENRYNAAEIGLMRDALDRMNLATSLFYRTWQREVDLFTSAADKETVEHLARPEIQKDVLEASIAVYRFAVNAELSDAMRMQLCWSAINFLSIYGTAYVFHGTHSYLSTHILKMTTYVAKSWSAFMHYFSSNSLLESEKLFWKPTGMTLMAALPAIFIETLIVTFKNEENPEVGAQRCGLSTQPTVSDNNLEIQSVIEATESLCQMGVTLPLFHRMSDNLGNMDGLSHVHDVVTVLRQEMSRIRATRDDTCHELAKHVPRSITMVNSALKWALALIAMPSIKLSALESQNQNVQEVFDTKFSAIISNILGVFDILEITRAHSDGMFSFSQHMHIEKEYAALSLVLIHLVQELNQRITLTLPCIGLIYRSIVMANIPLSSILLPSDVPLGIERCLESAENLQESILKLTNNTTAMLGDTSGMERSQDEHVKMEDSINTLKVYIAGFKELIREANQAAPAAAAKNRSVVLTVLPCAYVGCTTFPDPGQGAINSKMCGNCKIVRYCSAKCQKKDWKMHKLACKAGGTRQ